MSRIAPAPLVVSPAALDADRLGDRDLHVVDELAVPDRLEDAVREAQREHVLDRLLAEVVVDAEDLALVEVLEQRSFSSRADSQVVAERLLDDQPHPALRFGRSPISRHDRLERARRHGEVEEPVAVVPRSSSSSFKRLGDAVVLASSAKSVAT